MRRHGIENFRKPLSDAQHAQTFSVLRDPAARAHDGLPARCDAYRVSLK